MTPQSCLHWLRGWWTTAKEGTLCFCGLWLGFCVFATASSEGANKAPLHRAAAQGCLSQAHDVRGQPECQQSCQIQTGLSTFAGSSCHLCPHHADQRERVLEVLGARVRAAQQCFVLREHPDVQARTASLLAHPLPLQELLRTALNPLLRATGPKDHRMHPGLSTHTEFFSHFFVALTVTT